MTDTKDLIIFFRMEKIRIMELLLHCADISNCVKPWNIHTKFTGELLEEFFKQVCHFPEFPSIFLKFSE